MRRIVHEYLQTNVASPAAVFPLLCPVREAEWVPGWRYRLVFSNSGFAELGCVFSTPNEDESETTWMVTHFDPKRYEISFAWVWPEMVATQLQIRLAPGESENKTLCSICYTYTALSVAGESELAKYNRAWFENKMKQWEQAINHYLQCCKCIDTA